MHRLSLLIISISVLLIACTQESLNTPKELLCEAKTNPAGIATTLPEFSWKNVASINNSKQTGYQILVASSPTLLQGGKADFWDSGKVLDSKSVWIPYGGQKLQSRTVAYWKIKVWDQNNTSSAWSETQKFSVGLLNPEDWKGDYIGMKAAAESQESPLLRKTFVVNGKYDELFMHVNSLGYHELYINNKNG